MTEYRRGTHFDSMEDLSSCMELSNKKKKIKKKKKNTSEMTSGEPQN